MLDRIARLGHGAPGRLVAVLQPYCTSLESPQSGSICVTLYGYVPPALGVSMQKHSGVRSSEKREQSQAGVYTRRRERSRYARKGCRTDR